MAEVVSTDPVATMEIPDSAYDEEDLAHTGSHDEAQSEHASGVNSNDEQAESAVRVLRDTILSLFTPSDGSAGLPSSQRKDVLHIVQLALTIGTQTPEISILDLFPVGPNVSAGTIATVDTQFRKHIGSLTENDGWTSQAFHVRGGDATAYWNTKALEHLAEKIGNAMGAFEFKSQWDGESFGHPTSGAFMKEFRELLECQRKALGDWKAGRDLPVLLTYFSDATLLANKGSMSAHPVVVGIGNIKDASDYMSSLVTVGYLDPKISFSTGLSDDEASQVKRALVSKQVGAMMEQFKRCSFLGHKITSKGGQNFRIFTGLFDCAIDNPEVSLLLGHKSGYCGMCFWKSHPGLSASK